MNDEEANKPEGDRDPQSGRFLPGNSARKGRKSPVVGRANSLRAALLSEVTPVKIRLIANSLLRRALDGDTKAAELLLKYSIGPAIALDLVERLKVIEAAAGIGSEDEFDQPLGHPMVEYVVGEDGRTLTTIRRRPIDHDVVNDEADQ